MYKCLIIDDEKLARQLLEGHLNNIEDIELVASCKSAIEASKILNKVKVDLLFLDIEMPVLLGTEFYKNLSKKPKVIFTTAYREYAVEGFELDAVDYLVKPITFSRFFKGVEKFLLSQEQKVMIPEKQFNPEIKNYVFVTEERKQVKIVFDTVLYIESIKNYIKIKTQNKTHIVKYSISSFESVLDARFVRIHRSYIINKEKITAYTKQDIEIGEIEIPIGDSYRKQIENELKN